MCNSSYCLKLSYQLSYFLWYIVLTAFFFLLHDSHHALLSITYFEKTVKSSVLSILSFCAIFLCLKARGSSMKRGSFNKKRSVKRKSTKVCVVIISDVKKILWFVNGRVHFLFASQSSLCHWSQQHYRMIMSDLLITTDQCINQFRLLQWVTVLLRTI